MSPRCPLLGSGAVMPTCPAPRSIISHSANSGTSRKNQVPSRAHPEISRQWLRSQRLQQRRRRLRFVRLARIHSGVNLWVHLRSIYKALILRHIDGDGADTPSATTTREIDSPAYGADMLGRRGRFLASPSGPCKGRRWGSLLRHLSPNLCTIAASTELQRCGFSDTCSEAIFEILSPLKGYGQNDCRPTSKWFASNGPT
jgi:hypothetical protein